MIRDAIANAIKDRWPRIKITDSAETVSGGAISCVESSPNRINVDYPIWGDVSIRVACIDIIDDQIEATFYGNSKYANTLFHPESLTELEDLLTKHLEHVRQVAS